MAKEARKVQRAQAKKGEDALQKKAQKSALKQPLAQRLADAPDVSIRAQLKAMSLRLGIPVVVAWIIGGFIAGMVQSKIGRGFALGLPLLLTLLAGAVIVWALRQAKLARGIASILGKIETEVDRQEALAKLEQSSKKKDVASTFAKAQLELQSDPKKALLTLESIDLNKVMAPVADEARAQRAMIHLMQGQAGLARQLVDNIEIKRHQDPKTRALMTAILAEAWARTGKAKTALETLEVINPEEEIYEDLRPQLYRAYAFAYAYTNQIKDVRRVLRKLLDEDVRLLGGFMLTRSHPLLMKEAKRLAEQSGQVPRKMMMQRRP